MCEYEAHRSEPWSTARICSKPRVFPRTHVIALLIGIVIPEVACSLGSPRSCSTLAFVVCESCSLQTTAMSLPYTVQAPSDFLDRHPERIEQWKKLVRTDPRRAVRVLNISGVSSETIEGDTPVDIQYVMAQLRDVSKEAKGDHWKALVNAGVIGAL